MAVVVPSPVAWKANPLGVSLPGKVEAFGARRATQALGELRLADSEIKVEINAEI